MVFFTSTLIGAAALLSGFANGLPRPDSAIGSEVAVSAPNGIIMSDTAELYSQLQTTWTSSAAGGYQTAPPSYGSNSGSYGSSSGSYGSNSGSWNSGSSNMYGSNSGSYNSGNQYSDNSWQQSSSTITYAPPMYTATSSSVAWESSTASYGSGSSNWGNQGYNDCVQQCLASYSGLPPAATYVPTATNTPAYGTGATHTVIVAPTQGVLRYIPFAVNASVGDTIKFMWGANNHTVTKSSELSPCNRTSDALFTSGTQDKGFVFTQVVNDTKPTFFYCATPTHCQKGMFGVINPASNLGGPTSVGAMMTALAANSSDIAAYAAYTAQQTVTNPEAGKWGSSIDMSAMPEWARNDVAENVMFTRLFLNANPELLQTDGSIDLSGSAETPLMIPQDLSAVLASNAAASSTAGPAVETNAASTGASTSTGTAAAATNTSGASMAIAGSPRVLMALVAGIAGFLML